MSGKRQRPDEPSHDIEQRLINLIVKIGDKNVANVTTHLEGLSHALEGDLLHHRELITETIFDCAHWLQPKSAVYGTLVGLLNNASPDFGALVAARVHKELQQALDDHAPLAIRGLSRFVVELMNARVLEPTSAIELLEMFIRVSKEEGVFPARRDWFMCLAMETLVLCGKELSERKPEDLGAVMASLRTYAKERKSLRVLAPVLLPFGSDTAEDEVLEHFDALWGLVSTISADNSWSSPLLLAPARAFTAKLAEKGSHALPLFTLPKHTPGCTYPMLLRLRLLPDEAASSMDTEDAEEGAAPESGGAAAAGRGGTGTMAPAERTLFEEYTSMVAQAFFESHRDGAKQLQALQEAHTLDGARIFVETGISLMLALPRPRHPPTYYGLLLLDLSKLLSGVPPLLEAALNALYARLPQLDAELQLRLADWLALHVSHFGYSLSPFGAKWSAVIREAGGLREAGAAGEAGAATDGAVTVTAAEPRPHELWVRLLLDRMLRLAYHERVAKAIPTELLPLLPPKPQGCLAWDQVREGDIDPNSQPSLSAALLGKLRSKEPHAEVIAWLDSLPMPPPKRAELVLHSLLHAGAKSISHLEKLLEKFSPLLTHVAADAGGGAALVGLLFAYWSRSSQLVQVGLQKMMRHGVVGSAAVGSFLFSPPERWRLAHGASWELLHALVETALARQRECSDMLRLEERRAAELRTADDDDDMDMGGGGGGGGGGPAAERLARAQEALDAARREKKALFANLFAGACAALGAQPSVGGAPLPTWCGVTLSHMRAIGRRYVRELSIETLEMVVEGSDADTAVQAQLFEPLKQLTAYLS